MKEEKRKKTGLDLQCSQSWDIFINSLSPQQLKLYNKSIKLDFELKTKMKEEDLIKCLDVLDNAGVLYEGNYVNLKNNIEGLE